MFIGLLAMAKAESLLKLASDNLQKKGFAEKPLS